VLSHNQYTLIDRSAEPLIEQAAQLGLAFVNAAPYGGGMLAKGPDAQPAYAYREAAAQVRDAVRAMRHACAGYGVPLAVQIPGVLWAELDALTVGPELWLN
jgi:D-threo-aldose 1-dehydrogenase